jgi:hypothetical protein
MCPHPVPVWQRKDERGEDVYEYYGCGKCIICRQKKAREWATRLIHENYYHKEKCFITLTYSDDKIPVTVNYEMTLAKKDIQDFNKRLRKWLNKDTKDEEDKKKIRYLIVGEYSPEEERPHYHGVIFGWRPKDLLQTGFKNGRHIYTSADLTEKWGNGFTQVGSIEEGSIHYITGYLLKKTQITDLNGREAEKILASQGMGKQYALDHEKLIRKGELYVNGKRVGIPRYYEKILGLDKDAEYQIQKDRNIVENHFKRMDRIMEDIIEETYEPGHREMKIRQSIAIRIKKAQQQREKNLLKKLDNKKRSEL